jgi:hypothetical protein
MIEEIKQIQDDWYLIHLKDTRYYQVWNKWDLFEVLLQSGNTTMTLWDEDLPMTESDLTNIVNNLKEIKQKKNANN